MFAGVIVRITLGTGCNKGHDGTQFNINTFFDVLGVFIGWGRHRCLVSTLKAVGVFCFPFNLEVFKPIESDMYRLPWERERKGRKETLGAVQLG